MVARNQKRAEPVPLTLTVLITTSSQLECDGVRARKSHKSSDCRAWSMVCGSEFAQRVGMSSLSIYIIGFVILIAGLAYGASMAGLATQWIVVGVLVLLGLAVATGATRTRHRDPSHD